MCDALRELMKDDLEDARKLGESEGKAMGEVVGEAKIILKMNHSVAEQGADALLETPEELQKLLLG